MKFILISPEELKVPSYIREDVLKANHVQYEEVIRLEDALPQTGYPLHDPGAERHAILTRKTTSA